MCVARSESCELCLFVEVWGRNPWLSPIGHSHLVLATVVVMNGVLCNVWHGGTSV